MSIEQAKRAFETFVSTSEKAWKSLETSSPIGRASLYALNAKIAEITRLQRRGEFRSGHEARRDRRTSLRRSSCKASTSKQMETFVHQLEEMRDLDGADHPGGESGGRTDVRAASPIEQSPQRARDRAAVIRPYAPSSSFTPGGDRPHLLAQS